MVEVIEQTAPQTSIAEAIGLDRFYDLQSAQLTRQQQAMRRLRVDKALIMRHDSFQCNDPTEGPCSLEALVGREAERRDDVARAETVRLEDGRLAVAFLGG